MFESVAVEPTSDSVVTAALAAHAAAVSPPICPGSGVADAVHPSCWTHLRRQVCS